MQSTEGKPERVQARFEEMSKERDWDRYDRADIQTLIDLAYAQSGVPTHGRRDMCPECWSPDKYYRSCPAKDANGHHIDHDDDCVSCSNRWHRASSPPSVPPATTRSGRTAIDANSEIEFLKDLPKLREKMTACVDCDEAAKHAYSDATTPGFFSPKCAKHRESVPPAKEPTK